MKRNPESGLTIIELSIVMIIMGAMFSLTFNLLTKHYSAQRKQTTTESIEASTAAIVEAKIFNTFFLCPASFTARPGDADFGIADCDSLGIFNAESARDTDGNVNDRVLIGAVPFASMATMNLASPISFKDSLDGWGNRLTYVVSEYLASDATTFPQSAASNGNVPQGEFHDNYGVINVNDENGTSTLPVPNTAQFAILSHGENGKAAYSAEGVLTEDCMTSITDPVTGLPIPPVAGPDDDESENCDHVDAILLSALTSYSTGSYYDDEIVTTGINSSTLWAFTNPQFFGTVQVDRIIPIGGGNIGIGTEEPRVDLHVIGGIQANSILADDYCEENNTNCMSAESIAGNDPAMKCNNPNEVLRTIKNNAFTCTPLFTAPIIDDGCESGFAMCGISSQSGVMCRDQNDAFAPCT